MATKNIKVIKNGATTTLDNFVYNGVSCNKVYARASSDDEWILVFEKGGQIISMAMKISAGNWKMNPATLDDAITLVNNFKPVITIPSYGKCIVFPPACFIGQVAATLQGTNIEIGCQRISSAARGSYGGQVSASQVYSLGATWIFAGTNDARNLLGDTDTECSNQAVQALNSGLKVIYYVGENLEQHEAGQTESVLTTQLSALFSKTNLQQFIDGKIAVAYEPIWAIGTGKAISPTQAQSACNFIRNRISTVYGSQAAEVTSVLFAGSFAPANANEIAGQPAIDGASFGSGSAINATSFIDCTNIIFNS